MTGDRVGLKAFEGPGVVPVTKQLLQLSCSAHALYVMHLEKDQNEKEEAKRQLNLQKERALQRKQEIKARYIRLQSKAKRLEGQETFQQDGMEIGQAVVKEAVKN